MPKKSVYIPDDVDSKIIACDEGTSYSQRLVHLISVANQSGIEAAPALTVNEWIVIADSMRGTHVNFERGPENVFNGLFNDVYDNIEAGLHFGVNPKKLAQKLIALPFIAQSGVFEIARSFWSTPHQLSEGQGHDVIFKNLGAKLA